MRVQVPLRYAISLSVVLGLLLPAVFDAWQTLRHQRESKTEALRRDQERITEILALGLEPAMWNLNGADARALVDAVLKDERVVHVLVRDGAQAPFIDLSMPQRQHGALLTAGREIRHQGAVIGDVRLDMDAGGVEAEIAREFRSFLAITALELGFSLALILFLLNARFARPVARLLEESTALARRELDRPFVWRRRDELGALGQSLEATRRALHHAFSQIGDKTAALEADIAERLKTEAALRDSEARFRSLVELSSDEYWELDAEYRLTLVDGDPAGLRDIPAHEDVGKRPWERSGITEPDEAGWERLRAQLEAHVPFRGFESGRIGADGLLRHYNVSGEPVFGPDGGFRGYRGTAQETTARRLAEQERHETEKALADAEHHRELAAAEALRAEALQRASDTLARLAAIGRTITANLESEAVCTALHRHVGALMDAPALSIFLLDAAGTGLFRIFGREGEAKLPDVTIALADPVAHVARCARDGQEMVIEREPGSLDLVPVPQRLAPLSMLFAPLIAGDRLLGVLAVQSDRPHAYGERERSIFQSLCAYGAVALANAEAYRHAEQARAAATGALAELQAAQEELVRTEKLAALGGMVAGIAHEINTPIGSALTVASTIGERVEAFRELRAANQLKRSTLDEFSDMLASAAHLLIGNLLRAADLIRSFKRVAVDQTSEQRRVFELRTTTEEVVAMLRPGFKRSRHLVEIDISEDIRMDSYPGAVGQIVTNLVQNAVLHGFEGREGGVIRIAARLAPQRMVEMTIEDDGIGIAEEVRQRIFDPFFTTKFGRGGSGLGMHIVYALVTKTLAGRISVVSTQGAGTKVVLSFPLVAPLPQKPMADSAA